MAATFGRRSPCWGHHGEALCFVVRGSQGEDLVERTLMSPRGG
jgi:hypothetical protein